MDPDNIKYFVTWTINKDHNNKHAYVQVNALNQFQGNLDSSDADWPALGFLIPKSICEVLVAWSPPMLSNTFDLDAQLAPDLPELPLVPTTLYDKPKQLPAHPSINFLLKLWYEIPRQAE